MSEKKIKSRIVHKTEVEANWKKAEEKDDSLISFDDCLNEQVIAELKAVDINTLSPFECMSFLFDLKKRLQ